MNDITQTKGKGMPVTIHRKSIASTRSASASMRSVAHNRKKNRLKKQTMSIQKIISVNLFIIIFNISLYGCTCQLIPFCDMLTDESKVIEVEIIEIYQLSGSNQNVVDLEIISLLSGEYTFVTDKISIVYGSNCDHALYHFSEVGDSLVFMFEELRTIDGINYPTMELSDCWINHLKLSGDVISGNLINPPSNMETMSYELFKVDIESACESLLQTQTIEVSKKDFRVFSNPVNDEIRIELDSEQSVNYILLSNSGQILKEGKNTFRGDFNIEINDLLSGMYFLQIQIEEQVYIERLVKL